MYLVYANIDGDIFPACICTSETDAEEMCLSMAQEEYYRGFCLAMQVGRPYDAKLTSYSRDYSYMEVPYIG